MDRSYKQCSECGKRALSVATRCPGCGRELPALAVPAPRPGLNLRRFLLPTVAGATVVTALVLTASALVRSSRPPRQPSSAPVSDSTPMKAEAPDTAVAAARRSTATAAPSRAETAGQVLVARTWTNVRASRSPRAGVVARLLPSDTVLADSLERGWYRVAAGGRVLGYVYRSTLAPP